MTSHPPSHHADAPAAAAIGLLARQGYDATSVEDLADAAGMSRSTFFRKFGSKEDVVFADHERILRQVTDSLAEHHAIIDRIHARDGEGAEQAMRAHLRRSRARMLKAAGG